jgi:hypothetical protein
MDALPWAGIVAAAAFVAVLLFIIASGWYSPLDHRWLVLPRIFQWGSRAVSYLPKQTALGRTYNYGGVVIIVGAGAAGLAAARVLEDSKIKFLILEATERCGGRVKADTTFADFPVDLGAEWIHNLPGILGVMGGAEGEATQQELVPYRLQETREWDGRRLKRISALTNDFVFRFFPEYKFKRSTWYEFVRDLTRKVEHRIQYSSPVVEVDYSRGQVQLTTASGERFVADKVIMTASVGVLKSGSITFIPALSNQKKAALEAVEFLPGFKLLLKFSDKFYPDAVNWPLSEGAGERNWYDIAFGKDAQTNVLGFLATGAATEPYCKKSHAIPALVFHARLDFGTHAILRVQTPWSPIKRLWLVCSRSWMKFTIIMRAAPSLAITA